MPEAPQPEKLESEQEHRPSVVQHGVKVGEGTLMSGGVLKTKVFCGVSGRYESRSFNTWPIEQTWSRSPPGKEEAETPGSPRKGSIRNPGRFLSGCGHTLAVFASLLVPWGEHGDRCLVFSKLIAYGWRVCVPAELSNLETFFTLLPKAFAKQMKN